MKVKVGDELASVLTTAYRSGVPVMIRGSHGIGKTESVNSSAASLGISVYTLNLAATEPVDITGLPRQVDGTTVYSPPASLPKKGERGFLFLDELNRASRDTIAPIYQLLTSRCIHSSGYRLPSGILPISAINPPEEYDTMELDKSMYSRWLIVDAVCCPKSWLQWATGHGVHSAVLKYVQTNTEPFSSDSSPRSYEYASNLLHTYERDGSGNVDLLTTILCGVLGDAHGVGMAQAFLNCTEDPLSSEIILSGDYEKHRTTVKRWLKEKRVDLVNASVHHVLVQLQSPDVVARCKTVDNVRQSIEQLIADVPSDLGNKLKKALR